MRLARLLVRIVGWLLTPIVALLASFLGAWIGAGLAARLTSSTAGLGVTAATAGALALGATLGWLRLLRGAPKLREALAVTEEGMPAALAEPSDSEPE